MLVTIEETRPVEIVETADTALRYDRAKAELGRAKARGESTTEATEEFVAAREALRGLLEMIWPG